MSREISKETNKQPTQSGSWLTYVVVVFALIFVLGLLMTPSGIDHITPAIKRSQAQAMSSQLNTACRAYLTEYGKLPPTSENYRLVKTLTTDNPRAIPFINFKPTDLTPNGELLDPWGTPYRIIFDPDSKVHVNSAGPDRVFNTPDDVTSQ